jgi:hypothetical protein
LTHHRNLSQECTGKGVERNCIRRFGSPRDLVLPSRAPVRALRWSDGAWKLVDKEQCARDERHARACIEDGSPDVAQDEAVVAGDVARRE